MIIDIDGSSDQYSNSVEPANPLPGAVDQLSDPTFYCELPFPSVLPVVPGRFKVDSTAEGNWPYMGRTKFKELLQKLKEVWKNRGHTAAWLYGTQGYGKSHLLAALVCYLAAQDERVVYIPTCREWLRHPVGYTRTAMLFAWADDITAQKEIKALNTEDEIEDFFECQKNVIFIIDQMNALKKSRFPLETTRRAKLHDWLMRCTVNHKAVFSSSANYTDHLEQAHIQNSNNVLSVYGGLNRVSHHEIMSQRGF